ncbi:hypothetical protein GCM10018781_01360 [Kitasatospora indigofera]|uniref:Uncharacterized protein n=1 Tax=Kitasatospora indigofera TaxID=67307 RepID=A0A919FBD6_9ACTN|nr:hypothetical protein [Kitasatospora indigofera]GHH59015.1 hypothetical protein GCM10018781_01360 [Kitasatospora indigofera]
MRTGCSPLDGPHYDWAIQQAKGWLEVTVAWEGGRRAVEVYDPVRLAQSVAVELNRLGHFTARDLLVVPSVTREHVEAAVSAIADEDFFRRR